MTAVLRLVLFLTLTFALNGFAFATSTDLGRTEEDTAMTGIPDYPAYMEFEQYSKTLQPSEDQLRLEQVLALYEQNRPAEARALFGVVHDLASETSEAYINDAVRYSATADLIKIYNQQQQKSHIGPLIDEQRIQSLSLQMKGLCARYLAASAHFLNIENPKPNEELPRLKHNLAIIRSCSDLIDWFKRCVPTGDYLEETLSLIEATDGSAFCLSKLPKTDDPNPLDFEFAFATFYLHTKAAELYALKNQIVETDQHMATAKAIAERLKNPSVNLQLDGAHFNLAKIALLNNITPDSIQETLIGAQILDERRKKLLARFDQNVSADK